jgi:NADH:ubiquinone oxidoreductase subunit H
VLAASLFVVLFLGAGALPYVDSTRIAGALEPFVGEFVPGVLLIAIESGVFLAKLGLVFAVASKLRDASARLRDDQWLRLATRRLAPIAWANLLLVAALRQLSATWGELI